MQSNNSPSLDLIIDEQFSQWLSEATSSDHYDLPAEVSRLATKEEIANKLFLKAEMYTDSELLKIFEKTEWLFNYYDSELQLRWLNKIKDFPNYCSKNYRLYLEWFRLVYSFINIIDIEFEMRISGPKAFKCLELSEIQTLEPAIIKCWGWMRSERLSTLSKTECQNIEISFFLLKSISRKNCLRQVLMSVRQSIESSSDDSLNGYEKIKNLSFRGSNTYKRDKTTWSRTLFYLIWELCRNNNHFGRLKVDYLNELKELNIYMAEFCLSRIQYLKPSKTKDHSTNKKRLTEPSLNWQKAYIKALEEIRLDLGGKVHKSLFYIMKDSPNSGVQSAAKGAYQIVRHRKGSNLTKEDWLRGFMAAIWWLLYAQRVELQEEVNENSAIKTRRKWLRTTIIPGSFLEKD